MAAEHALPDHAAKRARYTDARPIFSAFEMADGRQSGSINEGTERA
jgi:hypothetical protein